MNCKSARALVNPAASTELLDLLPTIVIFNDRRPEELLESRSTPDIGQAKGDAMMVAHRVHLVVYGPRLGSDDTHDFNILSGCTATGISLQAEIVRVIPRENAGEPLFHNSLWRPTIEVDLLLRSDAPTSVIVRWTHVFVDRTPVPPDPRFIDDWQELSTKFIRAR